jgi:hypothetical protein
MTRRLPGHLSLVHQDQMPLTFGTAERTPHAFELGLAVGAWVTTVRTVLRALLGWVVRHSAPGGLASSRLLQNQRPCSDLPPLLFWPSPSEIQQFSHSFSACGARRRLRRRMAPTCFDSAHQARPRPRKVNLTCPNVTQYFPNINPIIIQYSPIALGDIGSNGHTLGILRLF